MATIGNAELEYDIQTGIFVLIAKSHVAIHCAMDFKLYPLDTQRCKFSMLTKKNITYQEKQCVVILLHKQLFYISDIFAEI